MAVRTKVRCNAIANNEVHFHTVYEEPDERDTENQRFTKATPWGDISLGIDNPDALAQFEVNKEYYVDFTPAVVETPAAIEEPPLEEPPLVDGEPRPIEDSI